MQFGRIVPFHSLNSHGRTKTGEFFGSFYRKATTRKGGRFFITACGTTHYIKCPGAESNCRHTDFQSDCGSIA